MAEFQETLAIGGVFIRVNDETVDAVVRLSCSLPACPADVDASGKVDSADFFAFLGAFLNLHADGDFNRDGMLDSRDFFEFLAAFFARC